MLFKPPAKVQQVSCLVAGAETNVNAIPRIAAQGKVRIKPVEIVSNFSGEKLVDVIT